MKIVSLIKLNNEIKQYLNQVGKLSILKANELVIDDIEDANIIIGNVNPSLLRKCKNLKYLQLYSAGNDAYKEEDIPKGCILCNASGTFGETISEHLLMVTLMLFRNMPYYQIQQQAHQFIPINRVKSIRNSKVLIVGTGDLGTQYAKRMQSLGAYTIGIKRTPIDKLKYFNEVHIEKDMKHLLCDVDVVCMCLPACKSTNSFLNKERLQLLKEDCIVLNVGRGNAIDTNELCSLLNSGRLLGAALDVFEKEPIEKENSIWNTHNLIITPHVSGTFSNENTYSLFYEILFDNLQRYFRNEVLRNIVDFKIGY